MSNRTRAPRKMISHSLVTIFFAFIISLADMNVAVRAPDSVIAKLPSFPRSIRVSIIYENEPSGYTFEINFTSVNLIHTQHDRLENTTNFEVNYPGFYLDVIYNVSVTAISGGGRSDIVPANQIRISPGVPSGPPRNINADQILATSIALSWDQPEEVNFGDRRGIIGYQISLSNGREIEINSSYINITNLLPDSNYEICIRAKNHQGLAPDVKDVRECPNLNTLIAVPNQPVLRGIVPFTKAVVVIWSAPVPRPGPILQYNVDYRVGESSFSDVAFESNTFLSTVITGIENTVGESHTVRIRALTAKGWGDYSDLYSFEFTPIGTADFTVSGCKVIAISYTVGCFPEIDNGISFSLQNFRFDITKAFGAPDRLVKNVNLTYSPKSSGSGSSCVEVGTEGERYEISYEVEYTNNVGWTQTTNYGREVKSISLPNNNCERGVTCSLDTFNAIEVCSGMSTSSTGTTSTSTTGTASTIPTNTTEGPSSNAKAIEVLFVIILQGVISNIFIYYCII